MNKAHAFSILSGLLVIACGPSQKASAPLRLFSEAAKFDFTVSPHGEIRDTNSDRLWAKLNIKDQTVKMVSGQSENHVYGLNNDPKVVWDPNSDTYKIMDDTYDVRGGLVYWHHRSCQRYPYP